MRLTHTVVVEYDDETHLADVYMRCRSSMMGDVPPDLLLVADRLARPAVAAAIHGLAGAICRDHQEVDDLDRAIR